MEFYVIRFSEYFTESNSEFLDKAFTRFQNFGQNISTEAPMPLIFGAEAPFPRISSTKAPSGGFEMPVLHLLPKF